MPKSGSRIATAQGPRAVFRSPRERIIPTGDSSIIINVGQTARDTYQRLDAAKRQALAKQIGVDQRILKELVDDVGIIVAEWICCPPTVDPYSTPEVQKLVESVLRFLRSVQLHNEALADPKISASGSVIDQDQHKAWRTRQQALAPLMTAINNSWHAGGRWDVSEALHIAKTLSDKKGGHDASQADRTVIAQDRLVEVWCKRINEKPSMGTTDPAAPDKFYTALLEDLKVWRPRTMFPDDRKEFDGAEVNAFFREVIGKGGIRLAIKRTARKS